MIHNLFNICGSITESMKINNQIINNESPAYFIADIAANHDGDIDRAKKLIDLAKESGADCVKFQHFNADTIVSDLGFRTIPKRYLSHQATWKKSVYQIYKDASVPLEWTPVLKEYCDSNNIEFMTTPYDIDYLDYLNQYLNAFKIGSGDITWHEFLDKISSYQKPVILSTGASNIDEVVAAVELVSQKAKDIVVMQCNTNYTADVENFKYVNLNVLLTYKKLFPDALLGLSDHTFGSTTVLGAVSLGAKFIEKHFTDDNSRDGPDHKFSMNPETWKEMVLRTRELEYSLGTGSKKVEENELETVVLQRRCLRAAKDIKARTTITEECIAVLRPAPLDSIYPKHKPDLFSKILINDLKKGDYFKWEYLI